MLGRTPAVNVWRLLPLAALPGIALVILPGCANYRLGTGSPAPFATLHLEPVTSQVMVPQAPALLATRLREAFIRDGRTRPVNAPADAEATLTVVITDFRREIAAARSDDTGLARKFNLTLGAHCTLRDPRTGAVRWERRPVSVVREVFTDSGQLQAEYQVLALLTEALAAKVLHAALDTW